jgi:hypothetical protein
MVFSLYPPYPQYGGYSPRWCSGTLIAAPPSLARGLNGNGGPSDFSPCWAQPPFTAVSSSAEAASTWLRATSGTAGPNGFSIIRSSSEPMTVQFSPYNPAPSAVGISSVVQQLVYPSDSMLGVTTWTWSLPTGYDFMLPIAVMVALCISAISAMIIVKWLRSPDAEKFNSYRRPASRARRGSSRT